MKLLRCSFKMTRRSETKPKKFSLVRFHVDDKYCIVESKKVKVDFPCAGQKDIDVALTIKSFFKADIIDVHDEYEYLFEALEKIIEEKCTPKRLKQDERKKEKKQELKQPTKSRKKIKFEKTQSIVKEFKNEPKQKDNESIAPLQETNEVIEKEVEMMLEELNNDELKNNHYIEQQRQDEIENVKVKENKVTSIEKEKFDLPEEIDFERTESCRCISEERLTVVIEEIIDRKLTRILQTIQTNTESLNGNITFRRQKHSDAKKRVLSNPTLLTYSPIKLATSTLLEKEPDSFNSNCFTNSSPSPAVIPPLPIDISVDAVPLTPSIPLKPTNLSHSLPVSTNLIVSSNLPAPSTSSVKKKFLHNPTASTSSIPIPAQENEESSTLTSLNIPASSTSPAHESPRLPSSNIPASSTSPAHESPRLPSSNIPASSTSPAQAHESSTMTLPSLPNTSAYNNKKSAFLVPQSQNIPPPVSRPPQPFNSYNQLHQPIYPGFPPTLQYGQLPHHMPNVYNQTFFHQPNHNQYRNQLSNASVTNSPASTDLVTYVTKCTKKGGVRRFLGLLLDHHFQRQTLIRYRATDIDRHYSGDRKKHGQLDPNILSRIKMKCKVHFKDDMAKLTNGQFNEMINNKCRRHMYQFNSK